MQEIQLSHFQQHFDTIIKTINKTKSPVLVADKGKYLVKILPAASSASTSKSWLGCMAGEGKITGDIISPVEDSAIWEALSE